MRARFLSNILILICGFPLRRENGKWGRAGYGGVITSIIAKRCAFENIPHITNATLSYDIKNFSRLLKTAHLYGNILVMEAF